MTAGTKGLAMITGAASGIGYETARMMQQAGYDVLLADLSPERLASAAAYCDGGPVETLAVDISVPDLSQRIGAALGGRKLAAVVHCAGISPTMADEARILEVNLLGSIRLMDALEDHAADGAAIVLIASNSGHMVGTQIDDLVNRAIDEHDMGPLRAVSDSTILAYSISKRAVMVLARREAIRKSARGIRVNSLSPGIINTPMGEQEMSGPESMAMMTTMIDQSPMKRKGQPSEIGAAAVFLCSDAASFITGTDLLVDGGEMTAGFHIPIAVTASAAAG